MYYVYYYYVFIYILFMATLKIDIYGHFRVWENSTHHDLSQF